MDWFLLAFLSALLSAAAAISQKKILFELGALEFSFILSLFNIIISIPLWYSANFTDLNTISILLLLLKTFLASVAFLNVMLAIKNLELSGALPLMVLTPGFVAVFAFFILDETLSLWNIFGLSCLIIGTYLIEIKKGSSVSDPFKIFFRSKNHHYILIALFCFTITAIMDKSLMKDYKLNPQTMVIFQQIFAALSFTIILLHKKTNPLIVFNNMDYSKLKFILFISLLTIGYRYFTFAAIKLAPVSLVLSVKRISVFIAALVGGKLFKESNLLRKLVSTLILLIGVYFILNY